MLGLSQTELGKRLGVTYQQIQKYEHGTNALAADRLAQVAEVLSVPISYFFEGLGTIGSSRAPDHSALQPGEIRFIREMRRLPPTVRDAMQQLIVSTNGVQGDDAARREALPGAADDSGTSEGGRHPSPLDAEGRRSSRR
jgi:transcriptional regulator with XRE-family HTH domain